MAIAQAGSVPAWQVFTASVPILVAVLTVFGGLILTNRKRANTLWQRLLGEPDDDTDEGFLHETEDKLEEIEGRMEEHAEQTHEQLYRVDRKLDRLVNVLTEEADVEVPDEVVGTEVPPPPGDLYRDGGPEDGEE